MKKRALAMAIVILVLVSTVQVCAAADGGAQPERGDYIYMGSFEDAPVKWKVLDAESMNTGDAGMYLISEYILQKAGTAFDEYIVGWQGSLAQEWCGNFYNTAFTASEQGAIPAVSKDEDVSQLFGLMWGATQLIDEHVFFLSSLELAQYVGDRDGAEGISATTRSGEVFYWWLRTSHRAHPDYSGLVLEDNQVHDFLVYIVWGSRPAMNLDLGKVLCFTPAYEGAEDEWKLTLADESHGLSVDGVALDGDKLVAEYSGAQQGEGEYISLLVRDADGKSVSYERLCQSDGAGTVEIPASGLDIPQGGSVCLFSEKDGGDYMTSYASEPVELRCALSFDAGEGSGEMDDIALTPGVASALPECGFEAAANRQFDHWELDGVPVEDKITIVNDSVLTAVYSNIPVSRISLSAESTQLKLFASTTVTALIEPDDAADKSISWDCADKAVSLKDKGDGSAEITAKFPDSAVISVSSNDGGARADITVTVTGSAYTAYAANYGLYALAFVAAAMVLIIFIGRQTNKSGKH